MIILVLDKEIQHWVTLNDVYCIKTGWADGEFTPVRFQRVAA